MAIDDCTSADAPLHFNSDLAHSKLLKVARAQSNSLHDITVLLDSLQAGLEALDANDDTDHLFRLAQMSKDKVAGVIRALNAHI